MLPSNNFLYTIKRQKKYLNVLGFEIWRHMEKEGFSITNVSIVGKTPCCDLKLTLNGNLVWEQQQISFEEIKEMMSQIKANTDSVVKQLSSFIKR